MNVYDSTSKPFVCLTLLLTVLCSCGDSGAKEEAMRKEREALGEGTPTRTEPVDGRRAKLEFEAQPGWIVETPTSSMRLAQFRLPAAEGDTDSPIVAVFFMGGGVQDNLQRWAGQFEGGGGDALADVIVKDVANLRMHTLDISGKMLTDSMGTALDLDGQRMLATVIEATDGAFPNDGKYFVRVHGPAETIEKWRSSYFDLLASL